MYSIVEMTACLLTTADATAYLKKRGLILSASVSVIQISIYIFILLGIAGIYSCHREDTWFYLSTTLLFMTWKSTDSNPACLLWDKGNYGFYYTDSTPSRKVENVIFFFHPAFTCFQLHSVRLLHRLMWSQGINLFNSHILIQQQVYRL